MALRNVKMPIVAVTIATCAYFVVPTLVAYCIFKTPQYGDKSLQRFVENELDASSNELAAIQCRIIYAKDEQHKKGKECLNVSRYEGAESLCRIIFENCLAISMPRQIYDDHMARSATLAAFRKYAMHHSGSRPLMLIGLESEKWDYVAGRPAIHSIKVNK